MLDKVQFISNANAIYALLSIRETLEAREQKNLVINLDSVISYMADDFKTILKNG